MSLDLSNKKGRAHNSAPFAGADFAAVAAATFDSGDIDKAGSVLLQIDMSANTADMDVTTLPTTMLLADGSELLTDGFEMTLVKVDASGNGLTFLDPVLGITYNYVDRQGESMTIVFDTSTGAGQWVAKI